ncbi:MAG: hypothetical protein NTV75_11335 [Bacteroidia bacterium]|nr:hypothetical protein [Bacteroidia bacterium]
MKTTNENIENGLGDRYKRNPFKVPEDYFEGFEARLNNRIEQQQMLKSKSLFITYNKPIVAIAAVLVLALVLTTIQFPNLFKTSETTVLADNEELNNSIGQDLTSNLSEAQILAAFSESDQTETKKISPDNLTDYIAANYSEYEIISNN